MSNEYMSYRNIPSYIGLKKGDRVYLSSDITILGYLCKKQGEDFSMDTLIDVFLACIEDEGTLIIPTFNFEFSNEGTYNYYSSPSTTGALGNCALKRKDFRRTQHPMHSFAVAGREQNILCSMENLNSFGKDSPFEYMRENNVIQVMLGTDYQRSMTFVHYVENMCNVPYRFYKEFTGQYVNEYGIETTVTYQYPARYLEYNSVEKFNRMGKILKSNGVSIEYVINDLVNINKVKLGDSYSYIENDIKNNMCRNIYDFSIPREDIWNNK